MQGKKAIATVDREPRVPQQAVYGHDRRVEAMMIEGSDPDYPPEPPPTNQQPPEQATT